MPAAANRAETPIALRTINLHKSFGKLDALSGVALQTKQSDIVATIVGSGSSQLTLQRNVYPFRSIGLNPSPVNWMRLMFRARAKASLKQRVLRHETTASPTTNLATARLPPGIGVAKLSCS